MVSLGASPYGETNVQYTRSEAWPPGFTGQCTGCSG